MKERLNTSSYFAFSSQITLIIWLSTWLALCFASWHLWNPFYLIININSIGVDGRMGMLVAYVSIHVICNLAYKEIKEEKQKKDESATKEI